MAAQESLAQCIRRLREGAGLTQEALAARAGVPLWSLRNWELGRRSPGLAAAFALAHALGAPLDELGEAAWAGERTDAEKGPVTEKARPKTPATLKGKGRAGENSKTKRARPRKAQS